MIRLTVRDRLLLSAFLLTVFCITIPAFAAPKISVDAFKHDFGENWEDTRVTHTFTVENTGDEELVIEKVRTS